MKIVERTQAESLRRQGLTYQEILERVPVSQGTLSVWLRDVVLSEDQKTRIHGKDMENRRKFIEYNRQKRESALARHAAWQSEAAAEIEALSPETLKWVGVALYWGEGTKAGSMNRVRFSNSDSQMIRLIMRWFREVCGVPEHKFRVSVQIHDDQNLEKVHDFWSEMTGIPREQFTKPAVRVSVSSRHKQKSILPYGTVHVEICDTQLYHRVMGWIRGLTLSAPSYSGLVRLVLSQKTGVRFPLGPGFVREREALALS